MVYISMQFGSKRFEKGMPIRLMIKQKTHIHRAQVFKN